MKFSLFLNSRGRPDLLKNFLTSVNETTLDKKSIEVIIRYDLDDQETESLASKDFGIETIFIKGPRPENLHVSLNEMARISKGENLFVCNDDIRILTKNWDQIALHKIEKYNINSCNSDGIYYCRTLCNSVDRDVTAGYCSFPIISKKATDILGFFMYEAFKSLGGDSSIFRVYSGVGRVLDLSEIKIDHIFHNSLSAVCSPDKISAEYRHKYFSNPINPMTFDVSKEVGMLKNYIDENSNNLFF